MRNGDAASLLAHSLPPFEFAFLPFLYPFPCLVADFCEVKAFSHAFHNTDFEINSSIEQIGFFLTDVIFFLSLFNQQFTDLLTLSCPR